MSPTIKSAGVLLAAYALTIGLWSPSAAIADDGDEGFETIEPEDLEGYDLPDFSADGAGNYSTWGSSVNVRSAPSTDAEVVEVLTEATSIDVECQVQGETVYAEGYTNDWWAYVPDLGGYLTNIYVDTPESVLPGIPTCDDGAVPDVDPDDLDGYDLPVPDDSTLDDAEDLADGDELDGYDLDGIFGRFTTWGSNVNVRSGPATDTDVVEVLTGPTEVEVSCQVRGELVVAEGYFNDWWAYVPDLGGYLSTTYVDTPDSELPGVPNCSDTEQEVNPSPEPDNSTTKEPRCSTFEPSYTPLDDRFLAELALLSTPYTASLLAYIHAANAQGYTVTLGAGLALSAGISGSEGVGVYFGPDGTYGQFVNAGVGRTSDVSLSAGAEMATLFGTPDEVLSGGSYVVQLSGGPHVAEVGAKVILSDDLDSVDGLAITAGVSASAPGNPIPVNLTVATEWTGSIDLGAARSLCEV